MRSKGTSLTKEVAQLASLSIVWAAIALVAFFLPLQPDTLQANSNAIAKGQAVCQNATPLLLPHIPACGQHIAFLTNVVGTNLVLLPIPIAALIVLVVAIIARARRPSSAVIAIFLFVAAIGAVCAALVFISTLGQHQAINSFIAAAEVIVISAVIGRLQRPIRQAFTDHPALSSLGTVIVVYLTFVLAQAITFTQILLDEANIWILAIAFGLLIYSGINMLNRVRVLDRGR